MAELVPLTGSVLLPDGSAPTDGQLRFALTATDTDQIGREAFPAGGVQVITLDDGVIPDGTTVWRNTAGLRGTSYQIHMLWTDADGRRQQKHLGTRTVGDAASYTLAGLLDADPPQVPTSYSLSITADEYAPAPGLTGSRECRCVSPTR